MADSTLNANRTVSYYRYNEKEGRKQGEEGERARMAFIQMDTLSLTLT